MAGTQRVPHLRLRSKTRWQQGPQRRSTEAAVEAQLCAAAAARTSVLSCSNSARIRSAYRRWARQTQQSKCQAQGSSMQFERTVFSEGPRTAASHCGAAPDLSDPRHTVHPAAYPLLEAPACATGRPNAAGCACCRSEPHLGIEHLAPHRPAEHVFERVPVQVDRPQALHRGRHGCLQRAAEADEHELHERWRRARAAEHSRQRRRHTQRCRGATAHRDK